MKDLFIKIAIVIALLILFRIYLALVGIAAYAGELACPHAIESTIDINLLSGRVSSTCVQKK